MFMTLSFLNPLQTDPPGGAFDAAQYSFFGNLTSADDALDGGLEVRWRWRFPRDDHHKAEILNHAFRLPLAGWHGGPANGRRTS